MANENNEFQLDVSADMSAVNSAEQMSFDTPKDMVVPLGDIDAPQSQIGQFNNTVNLPESQSFKFIDNQIDQNNLQNNSSEFLTTVEPEPSITYNFNQPDIGIEQLQSQPQPVVELPEFKIFEPTVEPIKPQTQTQNTVITQDTKVSTQDILDKTNTLSSDLQNLTKDVESMSQSMRYPDPRTEGRDNFEQRVTIDSTNLIFFNRMAKIIEYPNWS